MSASGESSHAIDRVLLNWRVFSMLGGLGRARMEFDKKTDALRLKLKEYVHLAICVACAMRHRHPNQMLVVSQRGCTRGGVAGCQELHQVQGPGHDGA